MMLRLIEHLLEKSLMFILRSLDLQKKKFSLATHQKNRFSSLQEEEQSRHLFPTSMVRENSLSMSSLSKEPHSPRLLKEICSPLLVEIIEEFTPTTILRLTSSLILILDLLLLLPILQQYLLLNIKSRIMVISKMFTIQKLDGSVDRMNLLIGSSLQMSLQIIHSVYSDSGQMELVLYQMSSMLGKVLVLFTIGTAGIASTEQAQHYGRIHNLWCCRREICCESTRQTSSIRFYWRSRPYSRIRRIDSNTLCQR